MELITFALWLMYLGNKDTNFALRLREFQFKSFLLKK